MSGGRLEHPPLPIGRTRYETPSVCRSDRCSRSEEHTSELQSQSNLVCRLLLEKKKKAGLLIRHPAEAGTRLLRSVATSPPTSMFSRKPSLPMKMTVSALNVVVTSLGLHQLRYC